MVKEGRVKLINFRFQIEGRHMQKILETFICHISLSPANYLFD